MTIEAKDTLSTNTGTEGWSTDNIFDVIEVLGYTSGVDWRMSYEGQRTTMENGTYSWRKFLKDIIIPLADKERDYFGHEYRFEFEEITDGVYEVSLEVNYSEEVRGDFRYDGLPASIENKIELNKGLKPFKVEAEAVVDRYDMEEIKQRLKQ